MDAADPGAGAVVSVRVGESLALHLK
ncbi:protein of unknown function (plasmid) [Cupriavidus taiwanensis]|nr:protein of unknown function [Cupriavidus taiwanensis]SOZ12778.1 protein of unknown function [Cupriavidus taiwanensis]SOZ41270.1 protein of unknown function [Cupriavidus taiwanensis]SPD54827.1 protein of unknown function [Cupriavidus taiwanensis]